MQSRRPHAKDAKTAKDAKKTYASGEEREDDAWVLDFGEWASVYRTWLERQAEYRDAIQRMQQQKPSLSGLIRVAA